MVDPSAAPDHRHPRFHRAKKYLAIVVGAVLLLGAGVLLLLHTRPGREYAISQVTRLLQQQNMEFATDELRYNLLDLRLSLRNLRLKSHETPDLPPFATIERVRVDLSLRALLRRRYVLQSGDAEGVSIHYLVDENGRDNLPHPPRDPDQPSEPLDYLIEHLAVRNATVRYENRPQRIDVTLPVSLVEVDGNATTDRHTVTLTAANGTLAVQDRRGTLEQLNGEIDLGEDDATISRLELRGEGAHVQLTGTVAQFAEPRGDLTVRGTIDAARAAALAGVRDRVAGSVAIDATAKGPLSTPAIDGKIEGSGLGFRNLSDLVLATRLTYDMAAKRAAFAGLQVHAPFGTVGGDGTIVLAGTGASRVTLDVSGLHPASLMRAFELPYVVASRVDARVQAEWPALDYLRAAGSATITMTPDARASRSAIPVGGRIDVSGRPNAVDAVLTRVTAAGAEVNGRIRIVDQRDISGETRIRVADAGTAVSTAEVVLGRPDLVPTQLAGAVDGSVRLGGTISAPTAIADINAPSLAVGTASGIALAAGATYTPALVTVRTVDVRWQQARAHASGSIGLAGRQPLSLAFDASALQVSELLRAMNQTTVPASGAVSFQGRVAGTVAQPAASITLNGTNLVAYNETWGNLIARANLAGRRVTVTDLALDKPQREGNGRLTGTGAYDLDRRTYAIDLRSQNVRLVSLQLPDGRPVRGTLQLTARGSGSVDEPSGALNLMADGLRVDRYDVGRVTAGAVVANRQADITAAVPAYALTANARIGTAAPYATTATLRVDNLQLAKLPLELQTPLEGQLRASVDATGSLQWPRRMQATALVDAFSGAWNTQPFALQGPARLRYANERLAIERLRVAAQDSTLSVQGELPLNDRDAPGAITVDARGNLATLTQYAPAGTHLTGSGALLLAGTVRGNLRAIDPDLTLTLTNGALVTPQIAPGVSNLNLRVRVAAGEATIQELAANWGNARIAANGRVPLEVVPALPVDIPRRGGPATFTASVQGLDLAQVPGAPQGLTGRVSVNADLSATRADLMALGGRITFPELQLAFNGLTLEQQQVSAIALAGGTARVERFVLGGSVGNLAVSGDVGLTGGRAIAVDAKGNLNVAVVSLFTDAVRAEGDTTLDIAARGTLASPELNGFVDMRDATFVVDEPTVAAEGVNARLVLSGRRVTVAELRGSLNGGTLNGSGHVDFGAGGIADVDLALTTNDVAFDAPLDLRSLSDAKIFFRRREDEFVLDGQITLDEAGLTGDINFDQGLLAALTARRTLDLTEERNPFLERVRFDLKVDTASPMLVDNNLARAEVTADLRVIGTPYEPGLSGRLTVLEGGEILLNERQYEVEQGVITFTGERRIAPSFDLRLNTTARNYDINITVSGPPGDTETSLTSDPALPEPDIMALLVTGRTLDEMRGEEFEIAKEQVMSYLAGRVGSQLGRGIERATGLDTVRLEPNLIANEANPSARLTVGEDIAQDLELIYSMNLADSSDQIWIVEYDLTRRFQTRGVRQSDHTYRADFRHDVRFGGRPSPKRIKPQRPILQNVSIATDGTIPESEVRRTFNLRAGRPYNFFDARRKVDDLEEKLIDRGYLQSRVRMRREADRGAVAVAIDVEAGPRVDLVFEGTTPPSKVVDEIRTKWQRGVFDTQRIDDSVEAIRGWLMQDKYLQPKVEGTVEDAGANARRARFSIDPGVRFTKVLLAFDGAKGVAPRTLDSIVEEQDLEQQLFTDPTQVTELLRRYYREQGYLTAEIDKPRYEFQGTQARVVLQVNEGPRFEVRRVTASGNTVVAPERLIPDLPVREHDPFLPFAAENALHHIRQVYWRRGYNDVRTDYELALDRQAGLVDVRFDVIEGPQSIIAGVAVEGNDKTSEHLIREQVQLQPEAPLVLAQLARARRNLYDTQAFSIVDIKREPLAGSSQQEAEGPAAASAGEANQEPVRLRVSVREVEPVQVRYGASFDTERGVGGIFDVSLHNMLGKARVLGLQSRYDGQLTDVRAFINQPALRYWPIETTASVYYTDERNPRTTISRRFNIDRRGASIQQERELANRYIWNWGFRYERARTFDPEESSALSELLTVTPLTLSLTRETRDEILDATRGGFLSQVFEYSPTWLGADQAYMKYFGQYFHYVPLQPERRERFTNEILRPRFVYAAGVRLGLARPYGGELPRSERFFGGGGTTLRGFEQDALGAIDVRGVPTGGNAMLVINNELRFPLMSIFDGVVFSDIGNVFPRLADISFTDLRETAGVGVRVRTPWFLLRGDYGVLLDRRANEPRARFYFSIGQAF